MSGQQQIKELKKLAYIDVLTGIPNRRYTEISLHARYSEMKRFGLSFGILMMDIDHFKKVNDTYGHDVGDEVLKMVAKTLADNARPYDIVGRWGGEEFMSIVVNITKKELFVIADRLRILVEQSMLTNHTNIIRVSISIGATMAQPTDTVAKLLKRADKLMYQCKACNRNCVTMD
jgi:diguanylate cyclase (GGDEF)-like protein